MYEDVFESYMLIPIPFQEGKGADANTKLNCGLFFVGLGQPREKSELKNVYLKTEIKHILF